MACIVIVWQFYSGCLVCVSYDILASSHLNCRIIGTYACTGSATSLVQVALSGKYSRDYFNRHGDLRHIRRLRYWPLDRVLLEKYEFAEQDAHALAEFLVPLLDFVPDKRLTAAQCLLHPWLAGVPQLLEEKIGACDAVQEGLRNIALAGGHLEANERSVKRNLAGNESSHSVELF